jgi:hypothetical protein
MNTEDVMGNKTNVWEKPINPSSLARSAPTPASPPLGEKAELPEPAQEAKRTVIKVLGSPQHMRKSMAPSPAPIPSTRLEQELKTQAELPTSEAKPEVKSLLKANPKFLQNGTSIEQRAPRARIKQEAKLSKRGSIGPGSRSSSRNSSVNSSPAPALSLAERNLAIGARQAKDAQQSLLKYKDSTCALFESWESKPELKTLDAFLNLDTDLMNYMRHLFSLAPEVVDRGLNLGDIMSCGVHFLWSCRNNPGTEGIQLQGTDYQGLDHEYFEHLQSFFSLVSKDLDFANLSSRAIEVGTVVDFRDSQFSQTIADTLSVLQQVYDNIFDSGFDDW